MRTALSMSQSLKMMSGDFPPSSRETFFTLLTAQLQTNNNKHVHWWGATLDSVWITLCKCGSLTSSWCVYRSQWNLWSPVSGRQDGQTDADPPEHLKEKDGTGMTQPWTHGGRGKKQETRVYLPDPGRILMTPLGSPALAANSANFRAVSGVTWKQRVTVLNDGHKCFCSQVDLDIKCFWILSLYTFGWLVS